MKNPVAMAIGAPCKQNTLELFKTTSNVYKKNKYLTATVFAFVNWARWDGLLDTPRIQDNISYILGNTSYGSWLRMAMVCLVSQFMACEAGSGEVSSQMMQL